MTMQADHAMATQRPCSQRRATLQLAFALGAVVMIGFAAWLWSSHLRVPPTTADPVTLANFVTSPKVDQMSDARRIAFMDGLRANKDRFEEAYASKKLTTPQFEALLLNMWISRSLAHAAEFARLSEGSQRDRFLDRLINRFDTERAEVPRAADSAIWDNDPYDMAMVKQVIANWPAERKKQWEDFHKALRARQIAKRGNQPHGIWY